MLIPRKILALHDIAAKGKTRYAMDGVRISTEANGRIRAEATDGKMLLRASFAAEPNEDGSAPYAQLPVIVPRDLCKIHAKPLKKGPCQGQRRECLALSPEGPSVVSHDATGARSTMAFSPVEGHFPPTDDVVPEPLGGEGVTIGLDAELLYRLATALHACQGDDRGAVVRLEIREPTDAIRVTFRVVGSSVDAVGVLMPVD